MKEQKINPEKITKPIQLLAAWLIGLIVLVGVLITGATQVTTPSWLPIFFSISSVAIIPLFLILIFQLQTKYRVQMQEDHYYSQYLNRETGKTESLMSEGLGKSISQTINMKFSELVDIQEKQMSDLNEKISTLLPAKSDLRKKEFPKHVKILEGNLPVFNLNIELPRWQEIHEQIKKFEYKTIVFFGENSGVPDKFILSFGLGIEISLIKSLVLLLREYGLTHLRIAKKDFQKDDIYVGSLATKSESAALTESLYTMIEKCTTLSELNSLIENNIS